jgi:peroxin-5
MTSRVASRIQHCNASLPDHAYIHTCVELIRRGVLTEAALALESVVRSSPDHAEAWRLLGTVHAENDDDQQVPVDAIIMCMECM